MKERTVTVKQRTEGVTKYKAHPNDEIDEKRTTQAGYCTYSILSAGLMQCLLRNFLSAENDEFFRWEVDTSRKGS
jgi:hypothetical protein